MSALVRGLYAQVLGEIGRQVGASPTGGRPSGGGGTTSTW